MIHRLLDLSTAHITPETCNGFLPSWGGPAYEKAEYGWFIAVSEDDPDEDLPQDLRLCLEYARQRGCLWLMFDVDAETLSSLPTYDW